MSLATMFQDKSREVALATALLIGAAGIYNNNAQASEPITAPGQQVTQTQKANHTKQSHLETGKIEIFNFTKEAEDTALDAAIGDSMPNALGSATHSHFSLLVSVDMAKKAAPIVTEWAEQYKKNVSIIVGPYTESHIKIFADGSEFKDKVNLNAVDFRDELRTALIIMNEAIYGDRLAESTPDNQYN
ncbi:MAG: hypothetical protein WBK77_10310 [Alphaproteobacteria bacterium]